MSPKISGSVKLKAENEKLRTALEAAQMDTARFREAALSLARRMSSYLDDTTTRQGQMLDGVLHDLKRSGLFPLVEEDDS